MRGARFDIQPTPSLPTTTADSNRGAEKHFQQTKFKTFCSTCKGVYAVKKVIGIEQNADSTEYKVILYCPAEHSRTVVQMVARSEAQKSALKESKAKSAKKKAQQFKQEHETELEIEQDTQEIDPEAASLDMLEPPEIEESDQPSELSVQTRQGDIF